MRETFIQLTVNNTRSLDQKRALYRRIVERLSERPGLRPEDTFINLVAVAPRRPERVVGPDAG